MTQKKKGIKGRKRLRVIVLYADYTDEKEVQKVLDKIVKSGGEVKFVTSNQTSALSQLWIFYGVRE